MEPLSEMTESTAETLSDEALVKRARESPRDDLRSFDTLVLRHRARVVANCRYLTRQPESAEDLAQDVFVKAYFALPRFRGGSTFRTWLQRIKINRCLDHLKSQRGRTFVDVTAPEATASSHLAVPAAAEQELIRAEARNRLAAAVDALPDGLRVPLTLRDLDGLAYEEIAETLDLSLSAVKMRILRARRELRARLEPDDLAPRPRTPAGLGPLEARKGVMADESRHLEAPPPPTEAELHEPVELLPPPAEDDDVAGAVFGQRVQRAIHRRLLGTSITDFCVLGPAVVALGLVVAVVGYWQHGRAREEKGDER